MRILSNEEGYVDFEAPIWTDDSQKEKLIKFLKTMFSNVIIKEGVHEKTKEVGERDSHSKRWDVKDLYELLGPESIEDLAVKLKRSIMSIQMQRGNFVPAFLEWAKKNGHKNFQDKRLIKEFLEWRNEQ